MTSQYQNDISARIASHLKSLRKSRGLSLDKTAQLTGVSKAMLGQIERGESSPTIATLWKIATGLSASFSSFITPVSGVGANEPWIQRRSRRNPFYCGYPLP
jgi:transcriptional regulator with XRE-family HTH domain